MNRKNKTGKKLLGISPNCQQTNNLNKEPLDAGNIQGFFFHLLCFFLLFPCQFLPSFVLAFLSSFLLILSFYLSSFIFVVLFLLLFIFYCHFNFVFVSFFYESLYFSLKSFLIFLSSFIFYQLCTQYEIASICLHWNK